MADDFPNSDRSIRDHITELIGEEHELRERLGRGDISKGEENARLRALEVDLDQCWDLLRQRQARRHAGQNPDDASARPADVVENYLE
ncbi:DUF2630 family protein [Gordonia polyisoprenivorans]|uniref:DUF2630 family protein n=1 Tax=Gordonia polyisoprenivorans TaxID=84595 RepID=UPI001AD7B41B|nr:DUF2630 family protein [Gordonia polyisoprenivorans]QTI68001.1 DUF2630 family protein [Gordonia polyisoprenivorans]